MTLLEILMKEVQLGRHFGLTIAQRTSKTRLMFSLIALGLVLTGLNQAWAADLQGRALELPDPVSKDDVPFARKVDPEIDRKMRSLEWRNVGPFVGGRGTGVEMHPTDRNVFYQAHSSGGVWKTDDAGQYWYPITDGQINVGPIGAIALAPSKPDVIYIGTGESQMRDVVSWGDGVYKSTDGGETWKHLGLKETRHISRVRVHPENPDLVYVAAMGSPFGPSEDRGVYRSKDGGETWKQVLFKHPQAGVIDLVMAEHDPNILYASTFELLRRTWGLKAGGPNSGIFKSTDGGDTWTEITRNPGLPSDNLGRIGLAHSKDMPNRISALIDSKEKNGLYQSEDGGENWAWVSDHVGIIQRPFYYYHLHANPTDGDDLWVNSQKFWRSKDAGKNWEMIAGTHDDYHDMKFDPNDPDRIIVTHDGGVSVTLNGGKTWTQRFTQPTQQMYQVHIDNQFPYNIYGNSQDHYGYRVPSASVFGPITNADVDFIGSSESANIVPHPTDPDIAYSMSHLTLAAGGGPVLRVNLKTGQWEHRSVWPVPTFGEGQDKAKYRFNWHAPLLIDPFNEDVLYTAAEVVFRSDDEGVNWEVISPVLTYDDPSKQQAGGSPSSLETSGQEAYNSIHRMVASTAKKGVLWTGSDDGLIHVTRNGGKSWENVTPPDMVEDTPIHGLEASPHNAGTLYVAATRYRTANDFEPYLWKTTDFGKTWTNLSDAFPQEEITRTIRVDTVREGLLFVGTETGLFASFDDGLSWRRFNLNLPAVPIRDIKVKDEDLVIASFGRGYWILDDFSPLRQWDESMREETAHLFTPRTHTRVGTNWWAPYAGGIGGGKKNYYMQLGSAFYEMGVVNGERKRKYIDAGDPRPYGAIIHYWLGDDAEDVSLSILDSNDNVIKTYEGDVLSQEAGLNRMIWDMNYPDVPAVEGKPAPGIVVQAPVGTYQAKLTVNGKSETQSFELKMNPNEQYTAKDSAKRFDLWWRLRSIYERSNREITAAMEMADKAGEDSEVAKRAKAFAGKLVPQGASLSEIANEPPKLLSKLTSVHWVLFHSEGPPPASAYAVVDEFEQEIDATIADWRAFSASQRN
jgi:photosystem II stability/assembly factor-like uncharacterized protein